MAPHDLGLKSPTHSSNSTWILVSICPTLQTLKHTRPHPSPPNATKAAAQQSSLCDQHHHTAVCPISPVPEPEKTASGERPCPFQSEPPTPSLPYTEPRYTGPDIAKCHQVLPHGHQLLTLHIRLCAAVGRSFLILLKGPTPSVE